MATPLTPLRRPKLGRRNLIALIAGGVVIVLVVTIVWLVFPRETVRETEFAGGTLTVRASSIDLEVAPAAVTSEQAVAMTSLRVEDYVATSPVSITTTGDVPESGVTLELALDSPLQEGVIATFAYFDEETGMWVPELTTLSQDRRTLSATVDHLSDWNTFFTGIGEGWNDFVTGVGDVLTEVGEEIVASIERGSHQFYRLTHELLGNAADTPVCNGETPYWLRDASTSSNTEIDLGLGEGPEGINAVLMCSGTDDTGTKLIIKAAANRGYGFSVELPEGMVPTHFFTADGVGWDGAQFDSTLDPTLRGIFEALYALGAEADAAGNFPYHPLAFVPPTESVSYVIDKALYEASYDEIVEMPGSGRVVEVVTPNFAQFLMSLAFKFLVDSVGDVTVAGVGPEVVIAVWSLWESCDLGELNELDSEHMSEQLIGDATWLAECLDSLEPFQIEKTVATLGTFAEGPLDNPQMANKIRVDGGKLDKVVKNLKWLAFASYTQTVIDYIGDVITDVGSGVPAGFAHAIGYAPGSVFWQEVASEGCWYPAEGAREGGCTTIPTTLERNSWENPRAFEGPNVLEHEVCTELNYTTRWMSGPGTAWYCPAGVDFTINGMTVAEDTIAGAITVFPDNVMYSCTGCGAPYNFVGGGDDPLHARIYVEEDVARENARGYDVVSGWFQAFWRVP